MQNLDIRLATEDDAEGVWEIFHAVVKTGDTYVYPPDISKEKGLPLWMGPHHRCYVASQAGEIVGTYILKANHLGLGSHVANASFMVHPNQHGKGIGKALAKHSLIEAKALGFLAMQFNLVVATNIGAIRLWEKMGFHIAGTLPKAFNHRQKGLIDAYVMYKELE